MHLGFRGGFLALDDACAAMGSSATQCAVCRGAADGGHDARCKQSDDVRVATPMTTWTLSARLTAVRSFGRFSLSDACDWDYLCGLDYNPEFQEGGVNRQGLRAGHVYGAGERQCGDDAGGDDRMAARLCASGSGSRPIGVLCSFGTELARARAEIGARFLV